MLHASNREKSRTIGHGKGGTTDKILHGTDSRHPPDAYAKQRTKPPTLQDAILQALVDELIRVTLVDRTELIGRIVWYSDGKFGFRTNDGDNVTVMSCNRIASVSPIEVDEEAFPFVTESLRQTLLSTEERNSRLQIVRRRMRERNKRLAAAAKYQTIHS
jgi:hypothetical protein